MRFMLSWTVVLAGCGGDDAKVAVKLDPPKPSMATDDPAKKAQDDVKHKADVAAKAEAIRKDRPRLSKEAVQRMRANAAREFGFDAVATAQIQVQENGLKDLGGDRWEVSGTYHGEDKDGKLFTAPFVVEMEIVDGNLKTKRPVLKDRTYIRKSEKTKP